MKPFHLISAGILTFALSGCYHYACPAPEGTTCKSISEIYDMSNNGSLDKKKPEKADTSKSSSKKKAMPVALKTAPAEPQEEEIKLAPQQILPIKILKYIDTDGDLHYPGYVFMVIQKSPWSAVTEELSPTTIRPPSQASTEDPEKPGPTENASLFQPGQKPPAALASQNGFNFQTGGISPQQSGVVIPTGGTSLLSGGKP